MRGTRNFACSRLHTGTAGEVDGIDCGPSQTSCVQPDMRSNMRHTDMHSGLHTSVEATSAMWTEPPRCPLKP